MGDVIADKYRIDGLLGEGGMAVVFAAHHTLLDKPIAVKILSPDLPHTPTVIERFVTEARAAAKVDSPNVARVMDVGTLANGLPYMVMERLDGCDLEELLRLEKQLSVGDAVDYVLQALAGLAHAHTLGIVHRD
ncbi:MAG TPA: serine/threonine-protein kinase, partial [Polyangiaceae bacterium]